MTSEAAAAYDRALLERSRSLILSLQTPEGAYPASPDFSAYVGYCWFRDGSFIADAMSAVGERDSAERFHNWCNRVITRYAADIEASVAAARSGEPFPDHLMLPARFTFDGGKGADEWWDFQLDGLGTWLWALDAHLSRYGYDASTYAVAVSLTVDYLLSSWQRPCYDWWEEHCEQVHISTLGCIGAGLAAATRLGVLTATQSQAADETIAAIRSILAQSARDGHLVKWVGSTAVDGSLSALIAPLGFIDVASPLAEGTLAAVERELSWGFGVHRFAADTFFGGGQWPLLSCFAGLAHVALGRPDAARAYLAWAASTATPGGDIPEQVDQHLLFPERKDEWVSKWGPVATPLLWSHAMVLRLTHELENS